MEIIAELEPTARGPYCGSLGYLGFDGSLDPSILIRTITAGRGWWQFPVGGGIVAQSSPEREYEETWHKADGLLRAASALVRPHDPAHRQLRQLRPQPGPLLSSDWARRRIVVRNDAIDAGRHSRAAARRRSCSRPAPARRAEAGCSLDVVRQLSGQIPILGVCLGHQAIAAAFGGGDRPRARADARPHERDPSRRQRRISPACPIR